MPTELVWLEMQQEDGILHRHSSLSWSCNRLNAWGTSMKGGEMLAEESDLHKKLAELVIWD